MCSYLMLKIKSFVSLKNESFFGQGTFQGGGVELNSPEFLVGLLIKGGVV